MSAIQYFMPVNTLKHALDAGKPKLASQAIAQAQSNLNALAGDCLIYIDDLLAQLEAMTSPVSDKWTEGAMKETYTLAVRFIGPASLAGLADLEHAARGLCELSDALIESARNDRGPVRVHVEAMRLLRHPDAIPAKAELLAGLEQVRLRFAARPGAAG